jgi:hypothetical protein
MFELLACGNELSRRQLAVDLARRCLGVTVLPWWLTSALDAADKGTGLGAASKPSLGGTGSGGTGGKAKQVIYLSMNGAMSQLDTFDPKPGTTVQGETKVIQTKVPGVQFSEYLPGLAQRADRLAVVRSLNSTTADHTQAKYLMSTSYKQIASTRHPGLASWIHLQLGRQHKTLPVTVQIGGGIGSGYLGAQYAPVPVGDPALGLQDTKSPGYLTNEAFDKRMALSQAFDTGFRKLAKNNRKVNGYDDLYKDAIALLRSADLKAFDIAQEPADQLKAYGDTRFGKGCLLARRLVENGVRYVEVGLGLWDFHYDLWQHLPEMAGNLDLAASVLLDDLAKRGLLKNTLVVIATEFGRRPEINQNTGRDHHPAAYSCVLAGGPIRGGQVYGESDENAYHVKTDGVTPEDFNATIAAAMGMPSDKEIHAPDGRPFTLGNGGKPLGKLLG